jgi:replication-associated recombination protein RarA
MMPRTVNKMDVMECISALQKHIRRGEEREAMAVAVEVGRTSKAFFSMLVNRMLIIAHEDIGLAAPEAVTFATVSLQSSLDLWKKERPGRALMMVGSAIRMLCRSPKSREGDHFLLVHLLKSKGGLKPLIPDYAFCMHTAKGRRMGRGVDHFIEVGAKLDRPPPRDPYEQEAIELLRKNGLVLETEADSDNPQNGLFGGQKGDR